MNQTPLDDGIRPCGISESTLFDYMDVDDGYVRIVSEEVRGFARHLDACPDCRSEVGVYRRLFRGLRELPVPVPVAAFERTVLGAALPAPDAMDGFWRRLAAFVTPRGLVAGGVSALAGASLFGILVAGRGGPRAAMGEVLVGSVRWGVDLLGSAVTRVVEAVRISDVLFEISQIMKPLWNAAVVVSGAVGPEFWLMSTLLSLLALMGAVRLAAGTGMAARAAEREVRHVSFSF